MKIVEKALVELVRNALNSGQMVEVDALLTAELLDVVRDPDLYYLAGNAKLNLSHYDLAIPLYRRASELAPHWGSPINNIGVCFDRKNEIELAYQSFLAAANIDPEDRGFLENAIFSTLPLKGARYKLDVIDRLATYLSRHPSDADMRARLGYMFYETGEYARAIDCAQRVVDNDPCNVSGIVQKVTFRLPVVYESVAQIEAVRASIGNALEEMERDVSVALYDPQKLRETFSSLLCDALFFITYNGRLNVDLISRFNDQICRLMEAAYGEVEDIARANRQARWAKEGNKKIRLAFVSGFVYGHSIWKIPMVGFYENLDRDKFEVYTYHMGAISDGFTERAKALSDAFFGSTQIGDVVHRLGEDGPDVVIFPDVGMNFRAYCVTGLRLAPLQLQMLGHPDTSGSSKVDFVVSAEAMERAEADHCYRESLLRLPALGCVYSFDYPEPDGFQRSDFGLQDEEVIFISPQSMFKYVPDDDELYPSIAKAVGEACKFVFIGSSDESTVKTFQNRLRAVFSDQGLSYDQHVFFIGKRLSQVEFVALCGLSDVFLDNPSWSGHNTVLDALHAKTLVLCMDGKFMRQRHAAAIMRHLGFPELVACDKPELVKMCAKYAFDCEYKTAYENVISDRLERLKNADCVGALEAFISAQLGESLKAVRDEK